MEESKLGRINCMNSCIQINDIEEVYRWRLLANEDQRKIDELEWVLGIEKPF